MREFDFRRFNTESKVIECEVKCQDCEFKNQCKNIDSEVLKYDIDSHTINKELKTSSIIFPKIVSSNYERSEKLLLVLLQLYLHTTYSMPCNSLILSRKLYISVYKIRKRLQYLVDHNFVSLKKEFKNIFIYFYSFNRVVNNIVKYYIYEFEKKFGSKPLVSSQDIGILSNLVKDYSENELRILLSKFFSLDEKFVVDFGYSIKSFYYKINKLLVLASKENKITVTNITPDQINIYLEGKKEGRWTGQEEWAKQYESAISKVKYD